MEVFVATRVKNHGKQIRDEGFQLLLLPFLRGSTNPVREVIGMMKLIHLYKRIQPDIVHHIAIKPILYGSYAARLSGVPSVVNTFAGLGYVFTETGWKVKVLRAAVKRALRYVLALPNSRIVFLNGGDRDALLCEQIVCGEQVVMIRSAGVDLAAFCPALEDEGPPIVLFAGRMLRHKGVGEFVEAARILRGRGTKARYALVGRTDTDNPASLTEAQLLAWHDEGDIEWWGHRDDMQHVLQSAHVVVLPSYGEGLPQILLEAGACTRAVVATSIPGCQEVVTEGDNGILVPVRDPYALARAIELLVQNPSLRQQMGLRGRQIVEKEFSMEQVGKETVCVYKTLLDNVHRRSFPNFHVSPAG
jgi:glycosyltransferase involved in cell wall biosynthesis